MLYNEKYPHDHVDDEREFGLDADGLLWVQNTGHGLASREAKVDELQDLLEEIKTLYNDEFPLDHVDDMGCELGHDTDGVLWVQHTGLGLQPRGTNVEELENLLGEVKGLYNQKYPDELHDQLEEVKALYNEKYPLDHVDNEALENVWTGSGPAAPSWLTTSSRRSRACTMQSIHRIAWTTQSSRSVPTPMDSVGCST